MQDIDLSALWVTLELAVVTVFILLIVGTPIAWWLAFTKSHAKVFVESTVALPLVLPPTVLGYYLLVAFGPQGIIGSSWLSLTGNTLAFSFVGLVFASVLYSFPFVVQPLQGAFEAVGRKPLEAAWCLGASKVDAFLTVASPLALRGYLTATVLGFAHTLGEFGVVLMVGGNIPGKTQVLSIAIFDHVEALEYAQAQTLSIGLLMFSFVVLLLVYALNRRHPIHMT